MEITEVNVYPVKKQEGTLKAFISVTIDEELVIKGLKIIEGKAGLFVSMPAEKDADDKYYDTVFPITADCRKYMTEKIMEEYEKSVATAKRETKKRR